jgi:hypothetical protein
MRRIALASTVVGAIALAVGLCISGGQHIAEYRLLSVWRSPDASVGRKADAIARCIRPGTKESVVIALLGQEGVWTHLRGPIYHPPLPRNRPQARTWIDVYYLSYTFPDGIVSVSFRAHPAQREAEYRFEMAWAHNQPSVLSNSPSLNQHLPPAR